MKCAKSIWELDLNRVIYTLGKYNFVPWNSVFLHTNSIRISNDKKKPSRFNLPGFLNMFKLSRLSDSSADTRIIHLLRHKLKWFTSKYLSLFWDLLSLLLCSLVFLNKQHCEMYGALCPVFLTRCLITPIIRNYFINNKIIFIHCISPCLTGLQ